MKVLVVSTNSFREGAVATPAGCAYIAGSALEGGHQVDVYDCMFAADPEGELRERVRRFEPDVVAVSIRYAHAVLRDADSAPFRSRHRDLRPQTKAVTDCIVEETGAPIVLGGPGFNCYSRQWLDYLDLDYGIRGEGEVAFPLFLKELEKGGDKRGVPGCVFRRDGEGYGELEREPVDDLDNTPFPAYELLDLAGYRELGGHPALFTKRGCPFLCTHCSYGTLDGVGYRLKSAGRVADEMERVMESTGAEKIFLTDNIFNSPKDHAEAICRELIERENGVRWTTDLRPYGITVYFARLLREAGCTVPNLAIESGSAAILKDMRRGYGLEHVTESASSIARAGLPYTIDLLLGGPGETPETVHDTLEFVEMLPRPERVYVTLGLALMPGQPVLRRAQAEGIRVGEDELFEGVYYMSPELDRTFLTTLVDSLEERDGWYYWVHDDATAGATPGRA